MKKNIYATYDRVSGVYLAVQFSADAEKDLIASINAAARSGKIGHEQDDFEIYYLGTFETETGDLQGIHPRFVARWSDFSALADRYATKRKETNEDVGNADENPVETAAC